MNIILLRLLLLLLPVLLYLAWRLLVHRRAVARGAPGVDFAEGPWGWLFIGGLVLVILSFVALAFTTGEKPGGTYVPSRYEDGRLIPGHIER